MAVDLMEYEVTTLGSVQQNVPRMRINFQFVDTTTQEILDDYTGANAVIFPAILSVMTPEEREAIKDDIARAVIHTLMVRKGY